MFHPFCRSQGQYDFHHQQACDKVDLVRLPSAMRTGNHLLPTLLSSYHVPERSPAVSNPVSHGGMAPKDPCSISPLGPSRGELACFRCRHSRFQGHDKHAGRYMYVYAAPGSIRFALAAMLSNGLCLVPSILTALSRRANRWFLILVVIDCCAIAAQSTGFWAWPVSKIACCSTSVVAFITRPGVQKFHLGTRP